ncbi:major facilitator superfamily domain-containing protein 8-like [Styela clava]
MNKKIVVRNICMGLFFFFSGVEYAVILPTLNGYLITFDAKQSFLGLVLAAFSFSGMISAPIYGIIADKTRSTKLCVIVANCFEILGNILYFTSTNEYMVLGARLIAGIGSGAASSIFGMIARTTTPEERTSVFSLLMSLRQIGMIVGPAFNIFLHVLDFYIGKFHINEYTSPGFLMTIIWFLHSVLLIIVYKDEDEKRQKIEETPTVDGVVEISGDGATGVREEVRTKRAPSMLENKKVKSFVNEFLREEIVICLFATFFVMFAQTGLETAAAPMTLLFFGWGGLENSYLFCAGSVVVVSSFVALSFLSKKFSDRQLVLFGCIGMIATYIMYFVYSAVLSYAEKYDGNPKDCPTWLLPVFAINITMLTIAVPFLWVPQASLFSKITSKETQAFNQGVRMVTLRMGQIIGPIWASPMTTIDRMPIMLAVDLFLTCMLTTMVYLSYNRLQPLEDLPKLDQSEDEEKTPLLGAIIKILVLTFTIIAVVYKRLICANHVRGRIEL